MLKQCQSSPFLPKAKSGAKSFNSISMITNPYDQELISPDQVGNTEEYFQAETQKRHLKELEEEN